MWGWQVAQECLRVEASVLEEFRAEEKKGLMGESGGVGEE